MAQRSQDVLFLLVGAVMILAMHAGFAFLELGTVRAKNQVNTLGKILGDFAVSAVAYFFVGYPLAYGAGFLHSATVLSAHHGHDLMRFFFLLTFAAAISAIIFRGHCRARQTSAPDPCHAVFGGAGATVF